MDSQFSLPYSPLKLYWAIQLSRFAVSLSGWRGLGAILSSGQGYASAPLLGQGRDAD